MSTARAAVLDAVRSSGRLCSVREIAERFDLHPNTVREHLDSLLEQGLVAREASSPTGRGRPALMYRATSATQDVARDYELLTEVLAEQISSMPGAEQIANQAGRSWGRREAEAEEGAREPSVTDVPGHVARLGFEPTEPDQDGVVLLRSCPILAAARRNPDVVCTVHLGFVQALLEQAGADAEDVDLTPMGHEDGCVLRIGALAKSSGAKGAAAKVTSSGAEGFGQDAVSA